MTGDYDTFTNRWTISATLVTESGLRIGGGQSAGAYSLSANPVIQRIDPESGMPVPYIPGSSLKGVIRSGLERILRTVNESSCCSSTTGIPCGECIACRLFGSMKSGGGIVVDDAIIPAQDEPGILVREQAHCATIYDKNLRIQYDGRERPRINLRISEIVVAGIRFIMQIHLDNATRIDTGLILLALDEFNHKRLHLGGASSRGLGIVSLTEVTVTCTTPGVYGQLHRESDDPSTLIKDAKEFLRGMISSSAPAGNDFDRYSHARDPFDKEHRSGCLTLRCTMTTDKDFQMKGVEEETATMEGIPYIPGSTIKGYLRHHCIEKKIWSAEKIYDLFGGTDNQRHHRSRILISDAIPIPDIHSSDKIPAGTSLKLWIILDNVESDDANVIIDLMKKEKVTITGNTSARKNNRMDSNNVVTIVGAKSKISGFRLESYLKKPKDEE